jgi:hypothetical protein
MTLLALVQSDVEEDGGVNGGALGLSAECVVMGGAEHVGSGGADV